MTSANLQQWLLHPETLSRESLYELRTMVARYPYFQTIRLLYLKNLYLLHDADFGDELRKAVLTVTDRRMLFYLIEGDNCILKLSQETSASSLDIQTEEPGIDRTLSLINAFLATSPEEASQQNLAVDYSVDYMAYLMHEEAESGMVQPTSDVPKLKGQELIDDFLRSTEEPPLVAEEMPSDLEAPASKLKVEDKEQSKPAAVPLSFEDVDDSCFTETLAKIYIKQHRYEKAL